MIDIRYNSPVPTCEPQRLSIIPNDLEDPNVRLTAIYEKSTLIIRNLAESESKCSLQRAEDDYQSVLNILRCLEVEVRPAEVKCCRIGSPNPRRRLLKVMLPFPENVQTAVRQSYLLKSSPFEGVFVRRSLSSEERLSLKEPVNDHLIPKMEVIPNGEQSIPYCEETEADLDGDSAAENSSAARCDDSLPASTDKIPIDDEIELTPTNPELTPLAEFPTYLHDCYAMSSDLERHCSKLVAQLKKSPDDVIGMGVVAFLEPFLRTLSTANDGFSLLIDSPLRSIPKDLPIVPATPVMSSKSKKKSAKRRK